LPAGTLSKTLFRRWIQRATLKRLNGITDMNHEEGTQGAKPTKSPTPIEAEIYDEWLDYLNTYPPTYGDFAADAQKKNYTVETGHAGNSYIHFTLEGKDLFGSIQTLFATEQCPNAIFARVSLFLDVDQKGLESTLTARFPASITDYSQDQRLPKQLSYASNISLDMWRLCQMFRSVWN
ncbi:hypothetical protein PSHT_12725, partial [Puccinia striiformis]